VLADISKMLAERGINIEAIAGYNLPDNTAKLMLVTSDNRRAYDALKTNGHKPVKESDVVLIELENKVGALKGVTETLAQNKIDIKYMYATTCQAGCPSRLIFATSDNAKAVTVLKK
jgi:hypothetical protein